jgi:glycosyltransferase involved in cell wall biosynthesis
MVSGDRQVVLGEKGPFFSMQREFSLHFHPADVPPSRSARWIVRTGESLIAEHGHGLVVSHDYGWFRNGVGSATLSQRTGVPYVSEIHHVPGYPFAASWRERFDRSLARRYVRWAKDRAAAFRVVNRGEMPPLLERWGVPQEKILVLPSLYIDLAVFRPGNDRPGNDRRAEHDQDLVFVGRMVENKGLDRIIDALARLAARGKSCSILFVGKGPMRDATRERARKRGIEGAVRFVEWVESPEDLARIYRRSRLVVCASSCEGGPRFTVEAMACGTPAVSTPVGVMNEMLGGDPSSRPGLLCGFDVESLASSIEAVLSDEALRLEMGRRAVLAASRYEYASTIRGYAAGLKSVAARVEKAA